MKEWIIAKRSGYEIKDNNLGVGRSDNAIGADMEASDSNSSLDYEEMQDEKAR